MKQAFAILILTLVNAFAALPAHAQFEDVATNTADVDSQDQATHVAAVINKALGITGDGDFVLTKNGVTPDNHACSIKIERRLGVAAAIKNYKVTVTDLVEKNETVMSLASPLVTVDKARRGEFKNLEVLVVRKKDLTVRLVHRVCKPGFFGSSCEDLVEAFQAVLSRDDKLRISGIELTDSYKALWTKNQIDCDVAR